jgi:phage terminase large subunit-like protein
LRVLASDAPKLHGLTPSLAIVDELHAFRDAEPYLALRTAMLKRPGARMVTISTAGQGDDSPLGRLRARGLALPDVRRSGALTEAHGPGLAFLEWATPPGDEPTPRAAKGANPAPWVSLAGLASQRDALPDLAWRRFHAGQWTAREGAWLQGHEWDACVGDPTFIDGEQVWAGLDVGGERSATALVWMNERLHVGCAFWTGDEGVLRAAEAVRELSARYRVAALAYDPWRATQLALEAQQAGVPVVQWPQTDARACPASMRLHEAIKQRSLVLPADATLRQHAMNAIQRHSRRGWRIDRPSRGAEAAIDGVIALAMCLERLEAPRESFLYVGLA